MSFRSIRNSVRDFPPRTKLFVLLGFIVLLAMIMIHFAFIYNYSNAHPRSDIWRHMLKIVLPWEAGNSSAKALWSNHHPNPALHLYQIYISGPIFDYDVRKDAYLSLTLYIFIFLAFAYVFLRVAKDKQNGIILFGLFATGFYYFFFQIPMVWLWTLVSLQSLGYIFGAAIFVCLARYGYTTIDTTARHKPDIMTSVWLGLITILSVLMNFDYGVLFFLAALGAMILVTIFHRDKGLCLQILIYAVIAVAGILIINKMLLPPAKQGLDLSILTLIKTSPELVEGYFYSLASAFWGQSWYKDFSTGNAAFLTWLTITFTTLAFLGAAIAALLKGRRGLLFLALMIYSALFSLAVFTARDAGDFNSYLGAPRYATTFKLGWVGALLALTLLAAEAKTLRSRRMSSALVLFVLIVGLVTGVFATLTSWDRGKVLRANYDRDEMLLYALGSDPESDFRLTSSIVGSNGGYDPVVQYFFDNNKSVFHPNYRAGPLLEEYKDLKSRYDISKSNTVKLNVDSREVPTKRANRSEMCVDVRGLTVGVPTMLDVDHISHNAKFAARLRLREPEYRRVLSVTPGRSRLYIQPDVVDLKICSWSTIEIISGSD